MKHPDFPKFIAVVNAARNLGKMFPGFSNTNTKHDHNADFGYPDYITFDQAFQMYNRNGIASSGIDRTILKTWEDNPDIFETEEPSESDLEAEIRQRFADLRVWQKISEADKRSLIGGYSALILRFADSKAFIEPVDTVGGGLAGLVEIIPVWSRQLTVSRWDTDQRSENYGQPVMYSFNESAVGAAFDSITNQQNRSFEIHPDRVIIWSPDGTVHHRSALEKGYNALVDMDKIRGAGGQGFWKNAKNAPVFQADKGIDLNAMAKALGVPASEIADKMDEQVRDWSDGFDAGLFLQGMEAKALSVTLPSPEHFFEIALLTFAASMVMPVKILTGMQTGERASTEDAAEWAKTITSRRNNVVMPNIQMLVNRLELASIVPERDWHINWSDLTETSIGERIERAAKMSDINAKMTNEPVYTVEEIREVTGHEGAGPSRLEGDDE